MNENYLAGWEGARLEYYNGSSGYTPITCITSRSETNETLSQDKVNVCTQGKVVTKATGVRRTVSITGEVVDSNSIDDMKALQSGLGEQTFKVYRTAGGGDPQWFKGTIMNVSGEYSAEEGSGSTFSMDININGDYLSADPHV